jgi:hypothetical protein
MSRSNERRRRALRAVAPVAGLLAAGLMIWQGSTAAFSATTNNSSESWATGSLVLTNNGGTLGTGTYAQTTTAMFGGATESNLKPGATGTKCLTVQSASTAAGNLKFYVPTVTGDATLATQLKLTIDAAPIGAGVNVGTDCAGFPGAGVVNLATAIGLSAQPTSYATAATSLPVAAGTQRIAYRFLWTFVSTGSTAGDNAIQGKSDVGTFTFELQ